MKLELKHLAPYLPYGLKWYYKNSTYNTAYLSTKSCALIDTNGYGGDVEKWTWKTIQGKHKPILRPLSDLNKKEHCVFATPEYNQDIGILMMPNVCDIDIQETQYVVIEKLFEWHFDVFGLIPAGLAIDINTL